MTNLLQSVFGRSARFQALLRKELLTTLKDRTSRMILVVPLILYVILFGYVATFNLDYAPYALLDMSKTPQSAELVRAVDKSAVFDRVMTLGNTAQIAEAIDSGKALVVLVIGLRLLSWLRGICRSSPETFQERALFLKAYGISTTPTI